MHNIRKWLVAGAAVSILVGMATIAEAQSPAWHTLTVRLPGGVIEHVTYSGDVKPEIVVLPNSRFAGPLFASFAGPFVNFRQDPAFAEMDRISVEMDREMDAMLHHAQTLQADAQHELFNASVGRAAPGTVEYSQVSTWSRNGVCTRTMRLTDPGNGGKPQMVSNTSGDCAGAHVSAPASVAIPAKTVAAPHEALPTRTL